MSEREALTLHVGREEPEAPLPPDPREGRSRIRHGRFFLRKVDTIAGAALLLALIAFILTLFITLPGHFPAFLELQEKVEVLSSQLSVLNKDIMLLHKDRRARELVELGQMKLQLDRFADGRGEAQRQRFLLLSEEVQSLIDDLSHEAKPARGPLDE
ncbi:MAG: hypothetical protein A2284_15325 [Deltaproteobacteria bacterium RIFOXYA12_FULL_61_11]|nr:MAG: hypothetical protein A2284_15325 [Deltaproteobacteria bacterium RIFOXYA12_FULL_61_11]